MASLIAYGDSNTAGTTSWANGLASDLGATITNFGTGSDQAADQSVKTQSVVLAADDIGVGMVGTNDSKGNAYGSDRVKQAIFSKFVYALIANLSLPDRKSARTSTKVGTWANGAGPDSVYSISEGSKVSFNVIGRYFILGHYIQSIAACVGSCGKVYMNGLYLGSFSSDGYSSDITTINGSGYGLGVTVFDLGQDGAHTIDVVQSSAGKRLYVCYGAGSDQPYNPKVAIANVIKMNAAAYAQYSTGEPTTRVLNGIIHRAIEFFQYMGRDVRAVDAYSVIDPDADLYDGVHLDDAIGDPKLRAAFAAALA